MTSKFQFRNLTNEYTQRRLSDILTTGLEPQDSSILYSSKKSIALPIPVNNNSQPTSSHGPLSTSVENKTSKGFYLSLFLTLTCTFIIYS